MKPIKNDKYFSIKKHHLMRLKIPSKNNNQLILIIFTLKHFANILSPCCQVQHLNSGIN